MQHPFGALTQNFRLIRLRKFRGQQPAGPAGDGETQVVSVKCLMSLNGHLLRPGGTSPPCFSFTRFIVEQSLLKHCGAVSIEKDKYTTPAHSLKTTRSSHSAQYCRHQTYSDALKNSSFPPNYSSYSAKSFCVVLFFLCCFCFLFYQNFQICTPWCNAHVWANQYR